MSHSALLTVGVGVPLAVVAISLLFWWEVNRELERSSPLLLKASSVAATLALVALAVARFVFRS